MRPFSSTPAASRTISRSRSMIDQLAVRVARDDHVEAVRPEVDSGQNVGDGAGGSRSCLSAGRAGGDGRTHAQLSAQAVKEDPQPHVVVAFGLRMTNCAPSSPSR